MQVPIVHSSQPAPHGQNSKLSETVMGTSLCSVPAEIIYHIVLFLPSARCVASLAATCRHLHDLISKYGYRIFRAFLTGNFPAARPPPFWRDATQALIARARALERKGIVARGVDVRRATVVSEAGTGTEENWQRKIQGLVADRLVRIGEQPGRRGDRPTMGFVPVIDTYETWPGSGWADRKQVLAYGAGSELIMRIKGQGKLEGLSDDSGRRGALWVSWQEAKVPSSWDDIMGVHLMPTEVTHSLEEDAIVAWRSGALKRVLLSPTKSKSTTTRVFQTQGHISKTEISRHDDGDVLLVAGEQGLLELFHIPKKEEVVSTERSTSPFETVDMQHHGSSRHDSSRLLSFDRLALGCCNSPAKLNIFDLTPTGLQLTRSLIPETNAGHVHIIEPLSTTVQTGGTARNLFLAVWEGGVVRLHDLRSPRTSVQMYMDAVDQNSIYSLLSIGHEAFLAGGADNALVKVFDLRMPGYSYSEACAANATPESHYPGKLATAQPRLVPHRRPRDISVYLTHALAHQSPRLTWLQRLQNQFQYSQHPRGQVTWKFAPFRRYRGPVYSLVTPSSVSSTVYAGIEGGVTRLDFVCTDDLSGCRDQGVGVGAGVGAGTVQEYGCDEGSMGAHANVSAWYRDNLALDLVLPPGLFEKGTDASDRSAGKGKSHAADTGHHHHHHPNHRHHHSQQPEKHRRHSRHSRPLSPSYFDNPDRLPSPNRDRSPSPSLFYPSSQSDHPVHDTADPIASTSEYRLATAEQAGSAMPHFELTGYERPYADALPGTLVLAGEDAAEANGENGNEDGNADAQGGSVSDGDRQTQIQTQAHTQGHAAGGGGIAGSSRRWLEYSAPFVRLLTQEPFLQSFQSVPGPESYTEGRVPGWDRRWVSIQKRS